MIAIREETTADYGAIEDLLLRACKKEYDGKLVRELREQGLTICSLVATDTESGEVVGFLMGSRVIIVTGNGVIQAVAAGPFAVDSRYRKSQLARELISEGLKKCRELGESILLALGPRAYRRFGFRREPAKRLLCKFSPSEGFVAMEIIPDALKEVHGRVIYPEIWLMEH